MLRAIAKLAGEIKIFSLCCFLRISEKSLKVSLVLAVTSFSLATWLEICGLGLARASDAAKLAGCFAHQTPAKPSIVRQIEAVTITLFFFFILNQ
jgi:hypothetical protein